MEHKGAPLPASCRYLRQTPNEPLHYHVDDTLTEEPTGRSSAGVEDCASSPECLMIDEDGQRMRSKSAPNQIMPIPRISLGTATALRTEPR